MKTSCGYKGILWTGNNLDVMIMRLDIAGEVMYFESGWILLLSFIWSLLREIVIFNIVHYVVLMKNTILKC